MKRPITIILLAFIALGYVQSQGNKNTNSHFLKFDLSSGLHNFHYSLKHGEKKGGMGYGINLNYHYFFKSNWAIRTGCGLQTFYSEAILNYTHSVPAIDSDNEAYTLNTIYDNWREEQTATMLSIPVGVAYTHQLKDKWHLFSSLGLKAYVPLTARMQSTGGSIETRGSYPQYNVDLYGMPQHNYLTINQSAAKSLDMDVMLAATAELGVMHSFSKINIYAGAYLDYGLTNTNKSSTGDVYEINEYKGLFNSSQVEKIIPLAYGIKLGVICDLSSITTIF